MHTERLIVRRYIWSDVLSKITDDQNTLTHQYANRDDTPRNPLHGPVTFLFLCVQFLGEWFLLGPHEQQ